ncbi:hypothetical protein Q8A73_020041 [Channa argus]|nr:hypothetical protein Q8A73_020041 [Channa argus]
MDLVSSREEIYIQHLRGSLCARHLHGNEIFNTKEKILPYSLKINDTPGYGNIMGIDHDEEDRIELKACIQNLLQRIDFIEMEQKNIQQMETALKKHEAEMKSNANFTIEVDEAYKDKEPIGGGIWVLFYAGAVCCTVCEENCHYPRCSMAWYPRDCQVIKKGHCIGVLGNVPYPVT